MAQGDVLVVAEHLDGKIGEITFEMLAKAKTVAPGLGGQVVAVLLGQGAASLAEQLGAAGRVIYIEDAWLKNFNPELAGLALNNLLKKETPSLTMVANTTMGMDLAAALSASLNWPLIAYCSDVKAEGGQVVATSQIYGGKIAVEAASSAPSTVVTMLAGAAPAAEGKAGGAAVEMVTGGIPGGGKVRFKRLIVPEAGDVDITREQLLVSVGRGIGSKENIELVEELASNLGAALSASRPIIDNGWLPKQRQVGKSGLTVKPKFYLAVGISGAPEHLQGMKDAELIIAINTDPHAPIFEVADYGVVGDLFDIVPALSEKLTG